MPFTPYQFNVPSEYAASFTDGEKALSVATPISNAGVKARHTMSRWLVLKAGTYTIKCVAQTSGTWLLSNAKPNGAGGYFVDRKLLFTSLGYQGVQNYGFTVHKAGLKRLDIILQNMRASPGPSYVAFSIWQAGKLVYASTSTGWVCETGSTPVAVTALPAPPDERMTYPTFTVGPNWADGILERVTYLSGITASSTDVEQRRKLRLHPRRSFEMSFVRNRETRARLDNFLAGNGANEFMLPLWHEQLRLPYDGSPVADLTTITWPAGTLDGREFLPDTLALIVGKNPDIYDVVKITSVVGDTISLASAPVQLQGVPARIVPLRKARITDKSEINNVTNQVGQLTIRAEVVDYNTYDPEEDWGYCAPLFRFRVNWASNVTVAHERNTYEYDVETGAVETIDPGQRDRTSTRVALTFTGRDETSAFRKFLAAARGKAVRFWAPSFTGDIIPVGSIEGLSFDALPSGFAEAFGMPQDSRKTIGIVFRDGRPTIYRTITSVAKFGGNERFYVDVPMPPIDKADVERIQFMLPSRFDQDGFELKHHVADCGLVTASVMLKSAEIADMEPIECFVTSEPYPLYVEDQMTSQISLTSWRLAVAPRFNEGIDVGVSLQSATLRAALAGFEIEQDSLNVTLLATNGSLQAASVNYTLDHEGVDVGFTITEGTLRSGSVNYSADADHMNIGITALYGALFT